jgi:membrane protease YdiL (CAAX protease family)
MEIPQPPADPVAPPPLPVKRTIAKPYPGVLASWGIAGIVIGCSFLSAGILAIPTSVLGGEETLLLFYLVAMGVPCAIAWYLRQNAMGSGTLRFDLPRLRWIPFLAAGGAGLLFGVAGPLMNLIPMIEFFRPLFEDSFAQTGVSSFLMLVIAAPVLEEIIFRGVMLDGLLRRTTPLKAIVLSSFLFGLVHMNPWQFVVGFLVGVFAGWVYLKTRNLVAVIVIHAGINFSAYLYRIFGTETLVDSVPLQEVYGDPQTTLVLLVVANVALLVSVFFLRRDFATLETPDIVSGRDKTLTEPI